MSCCGLFAVPLLLPQLCVNELARPPPPDIPPAGGVEDIPADMAELQREIELLRAKVDAHPEVKRFAVENLRLSEVSREGATGERQRWVRQWVLSAVDAVVRLMQGRGTAQPCVETQPEIRMITSAAAGLLFAVSKTAPFAPFAWPPFCHSPPGFLHAHPPARHVQEVRRYEAIVKRQELAALNEDIDALRGEMLRLEDEMQRAQVGMGGKAVSRGHRICGLR